MSLMDLGSAVGIAAIAILATAGCGSSGGGGPMTPSLLDQKVLDYSHHHHQNAANPLRDVRCDPQPSVDQNDGSGTCDCTLTFDSGGEGFKTVTVNHDGSWTSPTGR